MMRVSLALSCLALLACNAPAPAEAPAPQAEAPVASTPSAPAARTPAPDLAKIPTDPKLSPEFWDLPRDIALGDEARVVEPRIAPLLPAPDPFVESGVTDERIAQYYEPMGAAQCRTLMLTWKNERLDSLSVEETKTACPDPNALKDQ